jgi:hypothetical protein
MLLNLVREMRFDSDAKLYEVDYLFTKDLKGQTIISGQVWLELRVKAGNAAKKVHNISKPTSTLYLSNEDIEKMVQEETMSFYPAQPK